VVVSEQTDLIERVGQQVLDGQPVDWSAVTTAAGTDSEVIESLRALEALARMHRVNVRMLDSADLSRPEGAPASSTWGHLDILESIGRGASAHVFRAWDTRLDREVALKLLAADAAQEQPGNSPIIHEGRLLARVRHPNVVTIYGAERIGDLVGLWMEFVRGRTLEEIARERTFTSAEGIDIGVALCGAVSAVHGAGLLHRDIKAHNVMQAADGRIVLMDFGTGRESTDDSATDIAGTPLYLAPELFQGAAATKQSDIYSIGVLLFRLLTGTYPVRAASMSELRGAHEGGRRITMQEAMPSLPAALARAIDRAIDPLPARRWVDADAFRLALMKARSSRVKALLLGGGIAALAVGLTASAFLRQRGVEIEPAAESPATAAQVAVPPRIAPSPPPAASNAPEQSPPRQSAPAATDPAAHAPARPADAPPQPLATPRPAGVRRSIQVVPLTNASGRTSEAWLSTALAEMVMREFRASEKFRWIPGAVPLAKAQLGQALITESALTIRPVIPADVVISGEYVLRTEPDQLQVTLRLQEATGRRPPEVTDTGSIADLAALVAKVAARARAALGDRTQIRSVSHQPASADAARWYAEGIWNRRTPEECATAMQRAIEADSRFAPAYITLAECSMFVLREKDRETPRRFAAQAVELAAGLPREERLLIEIRARVVAGGPAPPREAVNRVAYEELLRLFPDTVLYGFMVARGYANYPPADMERALRAIDRVVDVPGAKEDLGLLRMEGDLAASAGDFPRATAALARAEALARQTGDGVLLGYVLEEQSTVAHRMRDPIRELALAEDAVQSFIASGNHAAPRQGRARVQMIYEDHGGFQWARQTYDQLIAGARIRGNRTMYAHLRVRLAELLGTHGELSEARRLYDEVQHDGTEVLPYAAEASLRYGDLLNRQGDLAGARNRFQAALREAEQKQDLFGNQGIWAEYKLAQLALQMGDLDGALAHAARNIQGLTERGPTREQRGGLAVRSRVLLARDDLAASAQAVEEAGTFTSPSRQILQPGAFDVWITRAVVAIEDERFADARSLAQQAADLARRDLQPDREAEAAIITALAWLGEKRLDEAQRTLAQAAPRITQTEDRLLRLSAGVVTARLAAAFNQPAGMAGARTRLEQVVGEASQIGAVGIEFDARLALGTIQMQMQDVAAGRPTLAALERDATARGFLRIARKAAAARR
jgi:serine/threonine-protein kinase